MATITVGDSRLVRIARHLHIKRLEAIRHSKNFRSHDYIKAEAAYREAREMASIMGLASTEHAVWGDVADAAAAAGPDWAGRSGAIIDSEWLTRAERALYKTWTGEDL